ncbi:hypothetical protein AcV7_001937 [Taiwanofungus camphoratus]|nr:hypothetical protein AcV7_001937 [Antrodia cinnamomea]
MVVGNQPSDSVLTCIRTFPISNGRQPKPSLVHFDIQHPLSIHLPHLCIDKDDLAFCVMTRKLSGPSVLGQGATWFPSIYLLQPSRSGFHFRVCVLALY